MGVISALYVLSREYFPSRPMAHRLGEAICSELHADGIAVFFSDHAHNVAGAINDDAKKIHNVAAEYVHVKRVRLCEFRIGPLKQNRAAALKLKADLGADGNRGCGAA